MGDVFDVNVISVLVTVADGGVDREPRSTNARIVLFWAGGGVSRSIYAVYR